MRIKPPNHGKAVSKLGGKVCPRDHGKVVESLRGYILKQNLKTHIIKKCQIYEKLRILGDFLTKLGKARSTFEILGKSRKTRKN